MASHTPPPLPRSVLCIHYLFDFYLLAGVAGVDDGYFDFLMHQVCSGMTSCELFTTVARNVVNDVPNIKHCILLANFLNN